ncbi:DUF4180 domain-containing protein [bacterium]|nr:DUF4180 domain-containing protein [bacterium]
MIGTQSDIWNLIEDALSSGGEIVRDKADFAPDVWNLRSGLLGELAQKLVNYRLSLTLTGDFSSETEASRALRDYVRELVGAGGPIRFATPPNLSTKTGD